MCTLMFDCSCVLSPAVWRGGGRPAADVSGTSLHCFPQAEWIHAGHGGHPGQ